MQNAPRVIIVCVSITLFGWACRTEPSANTDATLCEASVTLEDQHGWALIVQADGSGELRHQRHTVSWPENTFAFQRLRLLPAFAPRNQDAYPYRWTYANQLEADIRQYGLPDTAWGAAWFRTAYRALEQSDRNAPQVRRLRKRWQQRPPPGVR